MKFFCSGQGGQKMIELRAKEQKRSSSDSSVQDGDPKMTELRAKEQNNSRAAKINLA